jgi:hypothetical protein
MSEAPRVARTLRHRESKTNVLPLIFCHAAGGSAEAAHGSCWRCQPGARMNLLKTGCNAFAGYARDAGQKTVADIRQKGSFVGVGENRTRLARYTLKTSEIYLHWQSRRV